MQVFRRKVMDDKEKLSLCFYGVLVSMKDTLSLPTDSTLDKCMKLSISMFALTLVCNLLGLYTFISWQGSLLCSAILVALLWKERRENDALLRMYRNARVSAQKATQYAKAASAYIDDRRRAASASTSAKKTAERKQPGSTSTNTRRNGSGGGDTKRTGNAVPNSANEKRSGKLR